MLNYEDLSSYQKESVEYILEKKTCYLNLEMGAGKTVISLTAFHSLKEKQPNIKGLIIAPLRVAQNVWHREISRWSHLNHITYSIAVGSPKKRAEAVEAKSDLTITNIENVPWLVDKYSFDYDFIIIDEASKFKSNSTKRFKVLKKVIPNRARHVLLLSGTPSPNSIEDLWSQYFLLDYGVRLNKYFTHFREEYGSPILSYKNYGEQYTYSKKSTNVILNKIKDITYSVSNSQLMSKPASEYIKVKISLNDDLLKQYKKLQDDYIYYYNNDDVITANNAPDQLMKIRQFSNGFVYDENKKAVKIHDEKINKLKEVLQSYPNERALIAYTFRHDATVLLNELKGSVMLSKYDDTISKWNAKKIKYLLVNPKSASHGLNLQFGGNVIIWYSLTYSLEEYLQLNGRLIRNGQSNKVKVIHLVNDDTIDVNIYYTLLKKDKIQENIINFFKS